VIEDGDVIHTKVLPVGGAHVTNDLAIGLRTSIDVAERLKLEFGSALPDEVGKRDEVNLTDVGGENVLVNKRQVAEIIEARVEEINKMVDRELQSIDRSGLLPAGIILTGGLIPSPRIVDLLKKSKIPVLLSDEDTFTVAANVKSTTCKIERMDKDKIKEAARLVRKNVDIDMILKYL
jgi:cell division protein FtsA